MDGALLPWSKNAVNKNDIKINIYLILKKCCDKIQIKNFNIQYEDYLKLAQMLCFGTYV
jgi:hypothetical protein